jgi:hypothetical protein
MHKKPDIDLPEAHRFFSANCFNSAWDLMEKTDRSAEEDEEMIRLAQTSHWHWTQRGDYGQKEKSIAYWQTSRIFAILGQADNARRYGQLCLAASRDEELPPFCLGYAYEALARAESAAGNRDQMEVYLQKAKEVAERMTDPDTQKQLQKDLESIR